VELVGAVVKYRKQGDGFRVVFRCTNREEFQLRIPPNVSLLPLERIIRIWIERSRDGLGILQEDHALVRWKEL
jgi:hypothetical protein